ncbi:hydroxypyruvate isomerase [Loktanella sp. D2R18]|uniref:hydroxypyruvate isomerase family protein n=1 Tax=Rhodobacterales TaxID=204455 RepID=UPI000DE8EB2F|nr:MULTISPECIES: TIM barrel protein [Rhodobacterales]MDO6588862.1 TIM barrel protein [Yoonia sp. 1_MG-2023]RBW41910.1 hydroxypyruvate isomerase [Loktanella sp. D2R18]
MSKYCANLTWLFAELPFLQRFGAAKDAGFDGVEVQFPYDVNAQDIVNQLARYDLKMVSLNCPPPNYTGGEPGWAAVPALQSRFQRDFMRAARYAKTLGAQHLHIMAGVADGPEAEAVYIENLAWAAAQVPKQDLLIEPINGDNMPGYFLRDYDLAAKVIAAVNAPNLQLLFDAYHAKKITGDVCATWERMRPITAHVQVAQTPDRSEPDASDIDYPAFFDRLQADGYQGWISGEYRPRGETAAGCQWLA